MCDDELKDKELDVEEKEEVEEEVEEEGEEGSADLGELDCVCM